MTTTTGAEERGGWAGAQRPPMLVAGMVIWLASETMFFGGLFAAYFTQRGAAAGWPPPGTELEVARAAAFSVVLISSSVTMQLGVRALAAGRPEASRRWIVATLVLGAAFLANQGGEWAALTFTVASHPFGSGFYVITGFHGLHVLGGMAAMMILLARAYRFALGAADLPSVEAVSAYWHFVDAVWIGVFSTLFLLR